MKTQFALLILSLCTFFPLAVQAQSPTTPQDMPISLSKPKPPGQTGLRRPVGDGNVWTFRVVPEPGIVWVEGPNWSYPGKGEGADPDWGQWGGGDGQMWLSWSSPQKAAPFKIRMTGKIGRPGGRGGQPIDTEASWEGEVEKKVWEPEPAITGGVMVMPQNQQLTPHLPHPVIVAAGQPVTCAVTEAIDKDTWTMGEETGEEEDIVTYEWTTSGGGFITPQNPQGTAPTAETQNTTWKAPMEPGEYILSCRIDDEPTEVPEEESGSRDDEALPVRTVKVWVVDVKFTPSTIRLYEGEARAVTATVTPEAMASYLTFTSSNPSVAAVSGSAPELVVSGLNAGIAQLQALYNGVVLKTAPIIVKAESEDEDENDLDDDGIPDHEDPDKDGDGIPDDPGEHKVWTPRAGISGHFGGAERQVLPGDSLSFQAIEFSDSDRWQQGTEFGEEADTLVYSWSASGGTLTVDPLDSTKISWQAPTGGNATGLYTITLQVDDEPQPIGAEEFGSRDDSAVTFTQQIRVAQKVWSAGLALGQDRDANGTVFENGRMVLPQDQTQPRPSAIKIAPGTALDCAVEAASDLDRWELRAGSYLLASGEEADSVTYQWESSGGSWVSATNTQAARWQAPAYHPNGNNSYTLKCLIDDLPTAVGSGEGGSRDDSPALVREVQVEVVSTPSRATLKLYKDEALTQELAGGAPVGGTVYAVLELQIGADEKLVSHSATVQIEERYPVHSEEERRLDWPIDFTAASGWQKKTSPSGAWVETEESPMTENSGIESVGYRLKRSWNTTNTPLGHNEVHTLTVVKVDGLDANEIQFAPVSSGQEYSAGPTGISADVKNMVITDVSTNAGNSDYFKFDPVSNNEFYTNPEVKFTISDEGNPGRYKWWVSVRETTINGYSNFVEYAGSAGAPGEQTVKINQNGDHYSKVAGDDLTEWGTYAFDIRVAKLNSEGILGEFVNIRSTKIKISNNMVNAEGNPLNDQDGNPIVGENGLPRPGHYIEFVVDENNIDVAKIGYLLHGERDASKMRVDLVDPSLTALTSKDDLSGKTDVPHIGIALYHFSGENPAGGYKGVFVATDGYKETYRDHQNKSMLAINKAKKNQIYLEYQYKGYKRITSSYYRNGQNASGFTPRIGHITGDSFLLRVRTVPESYALAKTNKWTVPYQPGVTQTLQSDHILLKIPEQENWHGDHTYSLNCNGVNRSVQARVQHLHTGSGSIIDPIRNETWLAFTQDILFVYSAGTFLRDESLRWQGSLRAQGYQGPNGGQLDAARHSYWNALMVAELPTIYSDQNSTRAFEFAELAGNAHEIGGIKGQSGISIPVPNNEKKVIVPSSIALPYRVPVVMDLQNNAFGRGVGLTKRLQNGATSAQINANRSAIQARILTSIEGGSLTIIDDWNVESNGGTGLYTGMLRPSDKTKTDGFWKTHY